MTIAIIRPSYGMRSHHPDPALALPQTSGWTASQLDCARIVVSIAREFRDRQQAHVPDLAMLSACLQESSLDLGALGDGGHSRGIFQIYDVAHPGHEQEAYQPWDYCGYPQVIWTPWETAWGVLGGDAAWASIAGRGAFLEAWVPQAQGSIPWPAGLGQLRYTEAVSIMEQIS